MLTIFVATAHQLFNCCLTKLLPFTSHLINLYYFSGHVIIISVTIVSHSDAALGLSALSFPLPLPPSSSSCSPPSVSSRNWSGSGSCRSMEIWVRTVYVIVASINALLICSGLQPSIHIIHTHTQCYTNRHTHTHLNHRLLDSETIKKEKPQKTPTA